MPPCTPQFLGRERRGGYQKKQEEVRVSHPPFHALVVAPETLEGIRAEHVCKTNHHDKYRGRNDNPRKMRSIARIENYQCEPRGSNHLNHDSKREVFPGNEWEKERVCDDERNKGEEKNATQHAPTQSLLKIHVQNCSRLLALTPPACSCGRLTSTLRMSDVHRVKSDCPLFYKGSLWRTVLGIFA